MNVIETIQKKVVHLPTKAQEEVLEAVEQIEERYQRENPSTKQNGGNEGSYLVFGKYRDSGRRMSTEEDFKIAEWHPTEAELNGD